MLARPWLDTGFSFDQYSVTGKAEVFFGVSGTNDFLIRYVRGLGASTRSTPLFELLQLGGTANVRGIEQGEFIGRNMAFDQSEAGINVESLWRWVHRKKT